MEAVARTRRRGAPAGGPPAARSSSSASWARASRAPARAAAAELGAEPLDADRELERELGEPIEAFFDREGEAAFRAREEELVLRLLERAERRVLGARRRGAAVGRACARRSRRHIVVHLEVDPDDGWRRASGKGRPLARDRARFDELLRRAPRAYESLADALLPAGGRATCRARAPGAATRLRARRRREARLVWAAPTSGDYPVYVGRGAAPQRLLPPARRAALRRHRRGRGGAPRRLHRRAGDARPSRGPRASARRRSRAAERVLRGMARAGVERDDLLVALGGGVVGDLGGLLRRHLPARDPLRAGAEHARRPGRLGVRGQDRRRPAGGQELRRRLPPAGERPRRPRAARHASSRGALRGLRGGRQDGVDRRRALWTRVRRGGEPDRGGRDPGCLRTKLSVVAEDERDAGRRQVLNLGHTVAHAIEAATGYCALRHGEAVASGCCARYGCQGGSRSGRRSPTCWRRMASRPPSKESIPTTWWR